MGCWNEGGGGKMVVQKGCEDLYIYKKKLFQMYQTDTFCVSFAAVWETKGILSVRKQDWLASLPDDIVSNWRYDLSLQTMTETWK